MQELPLNLYKKLEKQKNIEYNYIKQYYFFSKDFIREGGSDVTAHGIISGCYFNKLSVICVSVSDYGGSGASQVFVCLL